jgi:hypothetical protein
MLSFAHGMLVTLNSLGREHNCSVIDFPALFDTFVWSYPYWEGSYRSFHEYLALIEAKYGPDDESISFSIDEFMHVCQKVEPCSYNATAQTCVLPDLPPPEFNQAIFCLYGSIVVRELARLFYLVYCFWSKQIHPDWTFFISKSPFCLFFYLCNANFFMKEVILTTPTHRRYAFELLIEGVLKAWPELALSLVYYFQVVQTGLDTLDILSIGSTFMSSCLVVARGIRGWQLHEARKSLVVEDLWRTKQLHEAQMRTSISHRGEFQPSHPDQSGSQLRASRELASDTQSDVELVSL